MPLEKSTSLNREVTGSQPGATANTGKSKTRKETLVGQGQTISPPTPAMKDILHPDRESPRHTATADTKKRPKVDVMAGVRSDQAYPSTDIADNYI